MQSGIAYFSRALIENKVGYRALHFISTYDQLNMSNIAGCELLKVQRQLIESAHEFNPDMQNCRASKDFIGSYENTNGIVIDPKKIIFITRRQGVQANVLEQARKAKEERSLCLTRSYDLKSNGKGKDGGLWGEKPQREARKDK